jgi:membrane protease YdiL (CAAX protease family)
VETATPTESSRWNQASRREAIAPTWHTLSLIAIGIAGAIQGALPTKTPTAGAGTQQHGGVPSFYFMAILIQLAWFAYIWYGLHLRKHSLRILIGRESSNWKQFGTDTVIGLTFWVVWYAAEGLVRFALIRLGLRNSAGAVFPRGTVQIAVWILMAISSGISEEVVYRGYLLRQFSAWTGSRSIAVGLQGTLFGLGHTYLGLRQVVQITVSGILFGLLAVRAKNLRPCMVAHAWADIFGGIIVRGLPYT